MDQGIRREIGRRLQQSRREANLSQEDVAKESGVRRQTVSAWETGKTPLTSDDLYRLGILYGVSMDYILYGIRTYSEASLTDVFKERGSESEWPPVEQ